MFPLVVSFIVGIVSALYIFRVLANTNREFLYRLLNIDTSFAQPVDARLDPRRDDVHISSFTKTTSTNGPKKSVTTTTDTTTTITKPTIELDTPSHNDSLPEEQLSKEHELFVAPTIRPTKSKSADEKEPKEHREIKREISLPTKTVEPVLITTTAASPTLEDHNGEFIRPTLQKAVSSPRLPQHSLNEVRSNSSGPTLEIPGSYRQGHRRTHSSNSPTTIGSLSSASSPGPNGTRRARSPSVGEKKDRTLNLSSSNLAALATQNTSFTLGEKQHVGWVELGSIVAYKKAVWTWKFFVLQGGWLSFYKDEQARANHCHGWVLIAGNEVYERSDRELQIVIEQRRNKRIFHRHGPDAKVPPAKKKHMIMHRNSSKCRLRFKDEENLKGWLVSLKRAATATVEQYYDEVESDDEPYDDPMMDDEGVINIKPIASDEEGVFVNGEKAEIAAPNDITPVLPKRKSLPRKDSIRIVLPQEGKIVEVPAPRELSITPIEIPLSPDSESARIDALADEAEEDVTVPEGEEQKLEDSVSSENREGLMKLLSKAIGLDITTVSLPVTINEPASFIQRMAEALQYWQLLDKADSYEDDCHRMAFVATFALTAYSCNTRTTKPFNPYLGETFEFTKDNFRFVAEQVSHHPPVGASHADTEHFDFWEDQGVKTKFGGNSLACETVGSRHLILKKSGDYYTWSGIKTVVHNIILGEMWLDHFGRTEIKNHKTGTVAVLEFTKCGWFSKGRYEVKGWIVDSTGKTRISLEGKWNDAIKVSVVHGPNFPDISNGSTIWEHKYLPVPGHFYKLTPFSMELNQLDDKMLTYLPPTDSRLRKDRQALEARDIKLAGAEKRRLEERERTKRKLREQKGITWKPKFFQLDEQYGWKYLDNYWQERASRLLRKSNSGLASSSSENPAPQQQQQ